MKRRLFFFGLILVFISSILCAGDMANFINLGFSEDSHYFMFAQYGVEDESTFSYANLFMVEVSANKFVTGGRKSSIYKIPLEPGNIGLGALLTLLEDNISFIRKHRINHLKTGRMLYFLVNGESPKENLIFRDFNAGTQYHIKLTQKCVGWGKNVKASFYIDLTVVSISGAHKNYRLGLPDYMRKGVKNYRIKQIILSPDSKSMIFLLEREEVDTHGANIRYMVETIKINY